MNNNANIAVIGGGSWATAIVKMLGNNQENVFWWLRDKAQVTGIKQHGSNPRYLPLVELDAEKLSLSSNLKDVVAKSSIIILAIPSAFLKETLSNLDKEALKGKTIFSAIKGIVPENNTIVGEFLHNQYGIPYSDIGVITGPCHAEEVALEKLSYLTIACQDAVKADVVASNLSCDYIKAKVSDDIFGTEYSAVLKNIFALANGICNGLGYGDNFQAVLISNGIKEIKRFVDAVHPIDRDIKSSAYLGDLLVTAYSKFSRNRTFGNMVGQGKTAAQAMEELNMVAEGYYAVKCIHEVNNMQGVKMPITSAVYRILYEGVAAKEEMKRLEDILW